MDSTYVSALAVGVLVMLALYISLSQIFDTDDRSVKKSLALFCAAAGLLTTLWLRQHPDALEDYTVKIVAAGIAVVLALLALAKRTIEKK